MIKIIKLYKIPNESFVTIISKTNGYHSLSTGIKIQYA